MNNVRRRFEWNLVTIWEYGGEVVAALLIYFLLRESFGVEQISAFCVSKHSEGAILIGLILAACIAICAVFWGLLNTEFGKEIRIRGEAAAYSRAFAFPILISLVNLVLLLTLDATRLTTHLLIIVSIYNLLTFVTMIFNMQGLVRLWQDWERSRNDL